MKKLIESLLPATFICVVLIAYDCLKSSQIIWYGAVSPKELFLSCLCLFLVIEIAIVLVKRK